MAKAPEKSKFDKKALEAELSAASAEEWKFSETLREYSRNELWKKKDSMWKFLSSAADEAARQGVPFYY